MLIRLGIYEKAIPNNFSIEEKLLLAKKYGFDYLEISIDETDEKLSRLDYPIQRLKEIKEFMDRESFYIESMCLSGHRKYPLGSLDISTRKKSLEIMEKAIKFAKYLGINLIQLAGYDVYYEKGNSETEKFFEENLKISSEIAAAYGINLGFETMETEFMNTVSKSMKYINLIKSPYLGVYPDIGNLKNACILYDLDLVSEIKSGEGSIFAAHLKETVPGVFRNMDFGTGHTEYEKCIETLLLQGVRKFVGEFWDLGEKNYEEKIKFAQDFLRTKIRNSVENIISKNKI